MTRIWHDGKADPRKMTEFARNFMAGHLGIEFIEIGDNWLKARMPVDNRTRNPGGRLQGGASAALAESVASVAGLATVDRRLTSIAGLEVKANHVRPVGSGFVYGVATAESLGRRTQLWSVRITSEDGRLVCLATVTLAIIPVEQSAMRDAAAEHPEER